MRVNQGTAKWNDYYNRVLTARGLNYNAFSVAPHGNTLRAYYTVPTGKKAMIGGAYASLVRDTAATPPVAMAMITLVPGGATMRVVHQSNTVGAREWTSILIGVVYPAGIGLNIQTEDDNIDGTMHYSAAIQVMEFDE